MKILVLDESNRRRKKIGDLLEGKNHEVTKVFSSNDFMSSVHTSPPETIFIDIESWFHGKPIYSYFGLEKKLENIPIVYYNTPEHFSGFPERQANEDDRIFVKDTSVDDIVQDF